MDGIESQCRNCSPEHTLAIFEEMKKGSEVGARNALRFKIGMSDPNKVRIKNQAKFICCLESGDVKKGNEIWFGEANCYPDMKQNLYFQAMRDPVAYRCNPTHHWRTGDKYKVRRIVQCHAGSLIKKHVECAAARVRATQHHTACRL